MNPEDFTTKLQKEVNSSPHPCLVPFLKRSLPYLQQSLLNGELSIEGVNPPHVKGKAVQGQGLRANCTLTSNSNVVINQSAINVPLQKLQSMHPGQRMLISLLVNGKPIASQLVKTGNGKGILNSF